jgi:hypothetical protein
VTDQPPQTALQRLQRLRDQLAAEHAKAVRADQQPRPDLDHLHVTAHNGIAAGLEIAVGLAEHHLREAGEQPAPRHQCEAALDRVRAYAQKAIDAGDTGPGVTLGRTLLLDEDQAATEATERHPRHGLSAQQEDALWDAVAIPGPDTPTFMNQHDRVCRAVAVLLRERPRETVAGHCPACRRESLFLGDGGHVTCARDECLNPSAADQQLHGELQIPRQATPAHDGGPGAS